MLANTIDSLDWHRISAQLDENGYAHHRPASHPGSLRLALHRL